MEEDSVEVFQGNRFPTGFEQVFGLPAIKLVALVQRAEVALDGQGAVGNGVLGTHVGLVEIVDMLKKRQLGWQQSWHSGSAHD